MTGWIEEFIEWGLTREERPWTPGTASAYRRELRILERTTGKHAEELGPDDLRTYQAQHRDEPVSSWNGRFYALKAFCEFLADQGFYQQLNPQGLRRINPSRAITKRTEEWPRKPPPSADVITALAQMPEGRDKSVAMFIYHSGLKISEIESIKDAPVNGEIHVRRRGRWVWVQPFNARAIDLLAELGGRVIEPGSLKRSLQRRLPVTTRQIEQAAKRDFRLRGTREDGPALALLVGRQDLVNVARAYRDAVEAMEGPKPNAKTAITAAARALQEMLRAMGAKGNSLGPLFDSARSRGLFGPYDSKLADAMESLVDWVNADRSERGDTHKDTDAGPEDAALARRIVGALLLRLEALKPH